MTQRRRRQAEKPVAVTQALLPVIQADRIFAARWCGYGPATNDRIRAGELDHLPGVRAAARHRLAQSPAAGLEREADGAPGGGSGELESYEKFDGVGPHAETIETRARIGERYLECYESALSDPLLAGYTPADCPSELLLDLLERYREATKPTPPASEDDDCDLCFGIMSRACPRCNPLATVDTPPASVSGEVVVPREMLRDWYTQTFAMFVAATPAGEGEEDTRPTPPCMVEMEAMLAAAPEASERCVRCDITRDEAKHRDWQYCQNGPLVSDIAPHEFAPEAATPSAASSGQPKAGEG